MSESETDELRNQQIERGLSKLLTLLDPDPDQAGIEFNKLKAKLTMLIECNHCDDPDTLFDDMIDDICVRLDEGLVIETSIGAYLRGAAKKAVAQWWRKKKAQEEQLRRLEQATQSVGLPDPEQLMIENEQRVENREEERATVEEMCADKCRDELKREQLMILEKYLLQKDDKISERKRLAQILNLTAKALQMRVVRIKQKLTECIALCSEANGFPMKQSGDKPH